MDNIYSITNPETYSSTLWGQGEFGPFPLTCMNTISTHPDICFFLLSVRFYGFTMSYKYRRDNMNVLDSVGTWIIRECGCGKISLKGLTKHVTHHA